MVSVEFCRVTCTRTTQVGPKRRILACVVTVRGFADRTLLEADQIMPENYISGGSIEDAADFEAVLSEAVRQARAEDIEVSGAWEFQFSSHPGRWEAQIYRIQPESDSQNDD